MQLKCVHKDYYLATMTSANGDGDGRYRARVAIMDLADDRTRSQRFVDFEHFDSEAEANERAISGGKEWIDAHLRLARVSHSTSFAALN